MGVELLTIDDAMRKALGKVALLFGGSSSEREVSLQSGQAVLSAMQRMGIDVVALDTGSMHLSELETIKPARVFVALHGAEGEDGTWQGVMDMLGIPYSGSGLLASALAMDKVKSKQLWRGMGLPTAEFRILSQDTDWQEVIQQLGGKVMVKPATEGSSIGMQIAQSAEELRQAWVVAAHYDNLVIAEQWLSGSEYTVAILGTEALPPIKLETDRHFYDYDAKYLVDDTRYICPCGLNEADEAGLKSLALQAFESLGCRGWGRVDLMADAQGRFQLLEVNTVPGMTSHSLVPMAAKAAGLDFDQLVLAILSDTLQAVKEKGAA